VAPLRTIFLLRQSECNRWGGLLEFWNTQQSDSGPEVVFVSDRRSLPEAVFWDKYQNYFDHRSVLIVVLLSKESVISVLCCAVLTLGREYVKLCLKIGWAWAILGGLGGPLGSTANLFPNQTWQEHTHTHGSVCYIEPRVWRWGTGVNSCSKHVAKKNSLYSLYYALHTS
jgi:hypothetical protein